MSELSTAIPPDTACCASFLLDSQGEFLYGQLLKNRLLITSLHYLSYTKSIPYQEGISHLGRIGKESITAFICAERFPWRCKRRFIGLSFEERGWQVMHIIEKERILRPKPNKANLLDQTKSE
jgi:hypothetical protein